MSELLSRVFPAIRDVRTPLIVGAAWFGVLSFALALISRDTITEPADTSGDPVVQLVHDLTSNLPGWVVVAVVALLATIVGSGVVRLMDRLRQAFRFPANPKRDGLGENCECVDAVRSFLGELELPSRAAPLDHRLRQFGQFFHRSKSGTRDSPLDRDRSYLVATHIRRKPNGDPARRVNALP